MSLHAPKPAEIDGKPFAIGIVAARFNSQWVDQMLLRCVEALRSAGVKASAIEVVRVPGSHEVPWAVSRLAKSGRFDVLIALGVLLRGATHHHELVATAVADALLRIAVQEDVPVINGVMAVDTPEQAAERTGSAIDRGSEFAHAALEMAALSKGL